jgi:hypothetical protein
VKVKVSLMLFATVVAQIASVPNSQAQITISPTTSTSTASITTTSTILVFDPLTETFIPQTTTTTTSQTTTTTTPANVSSDVAAAGFAGNQNTNSISDSNTSQSLLPTNLPVLTQQTAEGNSTSTILTSNDSDYDGVWEPSSTTEMVGSSGSNERVTTIYKCSGAKCNPETKPSDEITNNGSASR